MATCRECIHWDECSIADGTTQFYGKELAANNVEELCVPFVPTKTETEIEWLIREGKRRNEIPIAKDITVKAKVKRYRKKPVVVEAIQWTGSNLKEIKSFVGKSLQFGASSPYANLVIETLEGNHRCTQGDFIIKGVKGEFYPCKPDIFKQTYEEVIGE